MADTLPQPNPARLSAPAPFFSDNSFVRGDQTRENNSAIWENLQWLDFAGLTNKNPIIGADFIGIWDSVAESYKYITYTQLLALLDARYATPLVAASYYANTQTGYGSTATKIPYFTNEPTNTPNSQFTVSNSATNGLSITILVAGVYSFSFCEDSGGQYMGLSLNASSVTTNIESLAVGEVLAISTVTAGGNQASQIGVTRRFAINDVIRPHTAGGAAINAGRCNFICEKVA